MQKLLLALMLLCATAFTGIAQQLSDTPAYKKYPTLPAFQLVSLDSTKVFNTFEIPEGKPTLFMLFAPDCDHCEMATDSLVKHLPEFKGTNIYLLSFYSLDAIKTFVQKTGLDQHKEINVSKDPITFFPKFFDVHYFPYMVVYDKHKKLVKAWDGGAKTDELLQAVKKK